MKHNPLMDSGWIPGWFEHLNHVFWVLANISVGYIGIALIVFVVGYFLLFDPRATTGGRLIFKFAISLIGVIGLVFISLFVDPRPDQAWYVYPPDVIWWRPIVRFLAYGYVAYTITSLSVLLAIRKWHPHKITTAPIVEDSLVQVRTLRKKRNK